LRYTLLTRIQHFDSGLYRVSNVCIDVCWIDFSAILERLFDNLLKF
jgi:hypothetical protein